MMYRQDIKDAVIDYIRNSGERVVDYDVDTIGVYLYCFETVVL